MMDAFFVKALVRTLNQLGAVGIFILLSAAFVTQLGFNELPCPLCLLQRFGFLGIALGYLMNLRIGFRPSHYAVSIISAFITAIIALRQIALHVVPGTGSYGSPILGYHLYTWAFLIAMAAIVITTLMLALDSQYEMGGNDPHQATWITHILFLLLTLMAAANLTSVVLQCGIDFCPDDPVAYKYSLE